MKLPYKILLIGLIIGGTVFAIGIGVSYYVMSQYPLLGIVFDHNPIAFLDAASRIAINQVAPTPTKGFNIVDVDQGYNEIVEFPESRLELETAEQIIEWSVAHQSQPWITNITDFLSESQMPISDLTLHLAFIDTKSGDVPSMTITYIRSNNTQIIEKGWKDSVPYNSYKALVTEKLAIEILKNYGNDQSTIMAIIQNYGGEITLIAE